MLRIEDQYLVVAFDRGREFTPGPQHIAEIQQSPGVARLILQCFRVRRDRFGACALSRQRIAQVVPQLAALRRTR
jgi:hypothetical protein